MSFPSRAEFPEQVVKLVSAKFPLVKIEREDERFSLRLNGQTASLENLYRMAAQQPEQMRYQVERWVVELLRASEGHPDEHGGFEPLRERILPVVLSTAGVQLPEEATVTEPLLEGLHVAYAIDSDRTITYIPKALFQSWGISLEELHDTAIANLVARSGEMQAHAAQDEDGTVNLVLIQTLDGYDASRILLPSLHERLREHLGSPFLAGVPNRDILVCFRNTPEVLDRVRQQIAEDFAAMPHQVTDQLFLVTADGIAQY